MNKNLFHKYLKCGILLITTEDYMYFFRYWKRVVDNYDTRSRSKNRRTKAMLMIKSIRND